MKNQFVPYELALELKELGFDQITLCSYQPGGYLFLSTKDDFIEHEIENNIYCKNSDYHLFISAPTWDEAINFIDSKGIYLSLDPDFYENGINWNWQFLWYLPKEKWIIDKNFSHYIDSFINGTFSYGDNGEYPTRISAIQAAVKKGIEILKIGKENYSK